MGVSCALSILQLIMIETLRGLYVLVYIEDVLVIQQQCQSTQHRLIQVEQMLKQLQSAVFKGNIRKSFSMQKVLNTLVIN